MNDDRWQSWCEMIGAESYGSNHVIIDGDHLRRDDESIIFEGTEVKYDLLVPKRSGLEIHSGDQIHDLDLIDRPQREFIFSEERRSDLTTTTFIDRSLEMTDAEERGINLGLDDLEQIETKIEFPAIHVFLTGDPTHVSGSCGEFKSPNESWCCVPECASRGYSDYRWRVNRTPHGVIIHETGHHVHRILARRGLNREIRSIFPPKQDITSYSGTNYRENFAESFRVYVTMRELLEIIDSKKVEFFDRFFSVPERDLKKEFEDYTGMIQYQIETANTNEEIRENLNISSS